MCVTYLLAMHTAAHEKYMHGAARGRHRVLSGTMVKTAEHDEGLSFLQLRINDARIAVGTKIGLIVAPEVGTGHDSRRTVGLEGVTSRHKQTEQHVPAAVVLIGLRVPSVVVLVVSVQLLRLAPRPRVHGDGNGK